MTDEKTLRPDDPMVTTFIRNIQAFRSNLLNVSSAINPRQFTALVFESMLLTRACIEQQEAYEGGEKLRQQEANLAELTEEEKGELLAWFGR